METGLTAAAAELLRKQKVVAISGTGLRLDIPRCLGALLMNGHSGTHICKDGTCMACWQFIEPPEWNTFRSHH
jgi:hypothetical protein